MKRLHNILRLLLLTILMGSCTLMMEDYTKEEEKKVDLTEVGREEPYTLETEYGDITFQYGDSTKVLSEDAVDYLVTVEDDSILYFSDNIPRDLLVPVGEYITMGCNEHLRHGLCSKVVELTQANGMFKMVTTRVPHGKVFKKLDMDIKLDYDQQMAFDPEDYLDEQDVSEEGDTLTVFTDWAFFGPEVVARKEAEVKLRSGAFAHQGQTRADDDDEQGEEGKKDYSPKDEDTDVKKTKDKDIRIFTINNGKISKWDNVFTKLTQKGLKISVIGSYHEQTTFHHIQKVSNGQDYVKDVYDETPSFKLKINAGMSKTMGPKELRDSYLSMFKGLDKNALSKLNDISPKPFMLHLPVPVPIPVELFLRIAPKMEANFSLMGEVVFSKGLGAIHKEVIYDNGQMIKKDIKINDKKNNEFSVDKFDIYGEFQVKGSVECLAGVGVSGGLFGLGAGAELGAEFKFKLSVPLQKNDGASFNVNLTPKIKAFAMSPAGKDWASLDFSIPDLRTIYLLGPVVEPFYPLLTNPSGKAKLQDDYNGGLEAVVSGSYQITELNMIKHVGADKYQVGVYFYEQQGDNDIFLGKSEAKTLLKYKAKYDFSFVDADYKPGKKYMMVPYIEHKSTGEIYRYDDSHIPCNVSSSATMTFRNLFLNKYDYKDDYEEWEFYQQVQITNLPKMVDWKQWGVIVTLDRLELGTDNVINRVIDSRKIPVTEIVYENNVDMKFRLRVKPRDTYDFEMAVTPYYETQGGDVVIVRPQDVNKMYLRMVRDMEGENEQYWDGYPTEGAQLVDMGGVGK